MDFGNEVRSKVKTIVNSDFCFLSKTPSPPPYHSRQHNSNIEMSMTNQNQQNPQNQHNQQNQPRYPKLNHEFVINDTMSPDPQNILPANHRNNHKYTHFAIDAINI